MKVAGTSPTPKKVGPVVPGGNTGNVARSTWNTGSANAGNMLGSGCALENAGFAEMVAAFIRTCAMSPEEVVHVLGSTPISESSRRNSQQRWFVAEAGVGPKPGVPCEAGSVFWQPVNALPPR